MGTIELTKENLQSTIEENEIVLVDFWADWCGPCKTFGPVFEKASEKHPNIVFAKCDTQAQPEVAASFGVQSIPTLVVFRDNVLIFQQAGALSPQVLEELIAKIAELDMDEVRSSVSEEQDEDQKPGGAGEKKRKDATPDSKKTAQKVVATSESSDSLAHLADDHVLRRQGVTREFLEAAHQAEGREPTEVAVGVLEMYSSIRQEIRENGDEGRGRARQKHEGWGFDPAQALAGLDADTRSEVKAVLRAIEELLEG